MLLTSDASKHVKDYEYTIECYEKVKDDAKDKPVEEGDHLEEDRQRSKKVRVVVELEDLFEPRSIETDKPVQPISRVLLVGSPGVGKTSLSKKYAFCWAEGQLGKEFLAVYVLPIRKLNKEEFDNSAKRKQKSLAVAIANLCFPFEEKDDRYENRRQKISDDLTEPSTLLILDGFDETDDIGREMLQQAIKLNCKLLVTSRPYNLNHVREEVKDITRRFVNEMDVLLGWR